MMITTSSMRLFHSTFLECQQSTLSEILLKTHFFIKTDKYMRFFCLVEKKFVNLQII